MTRQWLADVSLMCTQHLSGEHLEAHVFVAKMLLGHSLKGFHDGSMFFGAVFVVERHNQIAKTMKGHKTPLEIPGHLLETYPFTPPQKPDYEKSLRDLLTRCPKCRVKHAIGLEGVPEVDK